jgi:aspartate/methionine/tyrosine aminotransferase
MELDPFRLERYFAEYEFTTPYILCASDCESMSVGELLQLEDSAADRLMQLRLGYTESRGGIELRGEIAGLYDRVTPEQVLVHSGAEEAIFGFMNAILSPGDHIVVHTPCYQSLTGVAEGIGAEVSRWEAAAENDRALDPRELVRLLRPNTKAVVVNFPHNPTGFLPGRRFIEELSNMSDERGFVVFSDEVYRGLEYRNGDRLPAFADINENAVSLGVMSKSYGLAGLRIGWIATRNGGIYEKMAAFKDYTTICSSAPSEFLSALALRHGERIVNRNRNIIAENLDRLDTFFAEFPDLFTWRRPKAGPIAFPRFTAGPVDAFCGALQREAGVLLLPGTLYGDTGNCFRIGFGRADLEEGLAALKKYLDRQRGKSA